MSFNSNDGQISMLDAIGRIEENTQKERSGGLRDLQHVLQYNRKNPEINNFDDKSFHKIFEVLFVATAEERTSFLKALGPSVSAKTKSGATTRFTRCSQTLRLAVERGASNIRTRTLKALLDHIMETLLDPNEDCYELIVLDYAKCLSTVLAYEPHIEHFKHAQWQKVTRFCLDRIASVVSPDSAEDVLPATSRSSLGRLSGRSSHTTVHTSRTLGNTRMSSTHEFVACLRYLTAPSAAPVIEQGEAILLTVLQYVDDPQSMSQGHVNALAVVNNVLLQLRTEKIKVTISVTQSCLQVARNLWNSKLVEVKNELLIMLVLLLPYIQHTYTHGTDSLFHTDLETMLDVMKNEYIRRDVRDQLRMDDLQLSCTAKTSYEGLAHRIFSLRDRTTFTELTSDGERNWTLLRLLSCLSTLDTQNRAATSDDSGPLQGAVPKRVKLSHWSDELLRALQNSHVPTKVGSLQLVCFAAQSVAISENILESILERLSALCTDDSPLTTSWTLLALASCATQMTAAAKCLSQYWGPVWHLTTRLANSVSTCRASCHLLQVLFQYELVERSAMLETCDTMVLSIEVNGPSAISDTVTSFLANVVVLLQQENLRSSKDGAERILTWLFRTWAPCNFQDKIFAFHNASMEAFDILDLINACLGRDRVQKPCSILPIWGRVAQAWILHEQSSRILDYLLLADEPDQFLAIPLLHTDIPGPDITPSSASNESLVLGLSVGEVSRAIEKLDYAKDQRGNSFNHDSICVISSLAIVSACLSSCHTINDTRRADQLRSKNDKLLDMLFRELSSSTYEQQDVDAFLSIFAYSISFTGSLGTSRHPSEHKCISGLASRVNELLESRANNTQPGMFTLDVESDDGMEIDANVPAESFRGVRVDEVVAPRNLVQSSYHPTARRMGIRIYAKIVQYLHLTEDNMDEGESALKHLTRFLVDLNDSELLASRPMIASLHKYVDHFNPVNTGELFSRIMDGPLQSYGYERSETLHALLLEIMLREIVNWTDPSNSNLYQDGTDIYVWLTDTALGAKVLSGATQKILCQLLLRLLHIDPDYGQKEDLPSIRTTLFSMLRNSRLEIGHYLAERMSPVFSLYTLSTHDEVFDDLNSSLPADVEWTEGIAIRLLTLAHLASDWPSLLRSCIYGIFETAGQVLSSTEYATYCVSYTSRSLGLHNSQSLFKLFAPQLLFTWLDLVRPLDKVPFQTFGYETLLELLEENLDETYSQLVIRKNNEEIKWLVKMVSTTEEKILRAAFPKAAAYAMSWDIAFDKEGRKPCESHLRGLMKTKGDYQNLIRANFPYIIAQMYISLEQDEQVEKALERRPKYNYASDALKAMKIYSSSKQTLPINQQPFFNARYLLDQMERPARRSASQQDIESIMQEFTASNLTVTIRCILDAMHPALGPLHACQVVRKLRLLVAFAGDNAIQGYPLELLIRTLRPLAVEPHCADDTIGVLHYLFSRGMPYLRTSISTLTSTSLLLLLSMKAFMVSKHDKTTQESQFRGTVSNMQKFHDWLVDSLLKCQDCFDGKDDGERKKIFSSLLQACRDVNLPASADKRNPASSMLQALMDDERSKTPILGRFERKQVISLLCCRFESPALPSNDILGSDTKSVTYANCVWSATRSLSQASEYETWAARVLGRAFAASVTPQSIRPTGRLLPEFMDSSVEEISSTQAIASKLLSLLLSDDRASVAVSERVLRRIFNGFADTSDHQGALDFENLLPPQVCAAMVEGYTSDQRAYGLGRSSLVLKTRRGELSQATKVQKDTPVGSWVRSVATAICNWVISDPIVSSLGELIGNVDDAAQQLFPFLIHLALQAERDKEQVVRATISDSFSCHLGQDGVSAEEKSRLILETVLYLLTQPSPRESTRMDRLQWLDINYLTAAQAATQCNMPTAALYLIELSTTLQASKDAPGRSRRSSIDVSSVEKPSDELLLKVYKSVDDPDSFYGVQQAPSLQSVLHRVDHERDGLKGMMLHSAHMDASLMMGHTQGFNLQGIVKSMGAMNLNSLTHDLLHQDHSRSHDAVTTETMLESARKLQQWDLTPPQDSSLSSVVLYNVCRSMATTSNLDQFKIDIGNAMRNAHRKLQDPRLDALSIRSTLSSLAVLTEVDELTAVNGVADLNRLWELMQCRQQAWDIGRFDDTQRIISYRETWFGILSRNSHLREALHVSIRDVREMEVRAVVTQSEFARKNDLVQQSLAAATYLSELVPECAKVGIRIDAVAQFEAASVLWKQGEISSSVQMLQQLRGRKDLIEQTVQVGSAGLLAQLGHEIAVARLEKPEEIISQYLKPAIANLGSTSEGSEAGRVFHEFAAFCDQQLQNAGNVEDFQRLERLRNRRRADLVQLDELIAATQSTEKNEKKNLNIAKAKAKQWFALDDHEYQRARKSRDEFVRQSLENYLRALKACDDFDSSVVRFFALWLEHCESPSANEAVRQALEDAPSWKFVGLTNQLTSRLLDDHSDFQKALSKLVTRMCVDHPYHMVHTIYAGATSNVGHGDTTGKLRRDAATRIKDLLRAHQTVGDLISRIWQSCHYYVKLAQTPLKSPPRGSQHTLSTVKIAGEVNRRVTALSIPPATLHLDLTPSADYSNVPVVTRFRSVIKIAGGLSAPKVLTAMATDGKEYKQLFKGGNDDLRQDAIMEQVFAEVSKMLQNHKATRQRSIHIRTYKVIPLMSNTGVIEFVPNSLPLAEFLNPAHVRYHPTDMKTEHARSKIAEAAQHSKEMRYKAYREVTAQFRPVLRHFFFERFDDPDEWFQRRLAYTRSTAAISILGYVLGLGDRHTQNILLDEKSGEVIHIDLGVAFEAGRVLPIPEVVPFRLTRDVVDGMGVTKTEGVFRRSCEFTMEALREETDSIMTLLNVLRYDPLYNWTVSPLRAKRIQQAQEETEDGLEVSGSKKGKDEAGEADRALSVVEKKLSKTLSVAATVNELIQQAEDERNLAVLFAGWAAWA